MYYTEKIERVNGMVYGKKIDAFIENCEGLGMRVLMHAYDDEFKLIDVKKIEESEFVILVHKLGRFIISTKHNVASKKIVTLMHNGKDVKDVKSQQAVIDYIMKNIEK